MTGGLICQVQAQFMLLSQLLEKTLESPLDCKEIKSVNLKGNQPWILIGRTDPEIEAQYLDHTLQRTDSLEKILMLERLKVIEGGSREEDG